MKEQITIQSTMDYSQFKLLKSNRIVKQSHIVKLMKSIKRKNLLSDFPIIINNKFEVLDGQTRLEACKQLQIPVYYKISDTMEYKDISTINSLSLSWRPEDYVRSYSANGNTNYTKLNNFWIGSALPSLRICLSVLNYCENKQKASLTALREGLLLYPEDDTPAWELLKKKDELAEYIPYCDKASFILAYLCLVRHEEYNHQIMVNNCKINASIITSANTALDYVDQLEKLYNYKNKTRKYVRFPRTILHI